MDRLVDRRRAGVGRPGQAGQRCRRQHAQRACNRAGEIGEQVTEQVVPQDHIEVGRLLHQLVGRIVCVEQFELDVGVFRAADVLDHLPPQDIALHHIGFIDGSDPATAASGQRKGDPGNALDLGCGIEVGVKRPEAATFSRLNPAWLGKKRTAAELAHHHHVGLLSQALAKRCGVG